MLYYSFLPKASQFDNSWKYFFLSFVLFVLFITTNLHAEDNKPYELIVRKVQIDTEHAVGEGYIKGRGLFPQYKYFGLPKNFLIKSQPDLIIKPEHIERIAILKHRVTSSNFHTFSAKFIISSGFSSILKKYTSSNIGKYVALEVAGEILVVSRILNETESDFTVLVASKNYNHIEKLLNKVSILEIVEK